MSTTKKHFGEHPFGVLQSDIKVTGNGYGLLQLTANFAYDSAVAGTVGAIFRRGADFPGGKDQLGTALSTQAWTCVRHDVTGKDGDLIYVSAHYAAIDTCVGGQQTETEASITSAVVAEPIESHPNFTKIQCSTLGSTPLGGIWTNKKPPNPDDGASKNPYRAQWGPISTPTPGAVQYNFVGFLPSNSNDAANRKAGVKSWMRPSITMKVTSYMADEMNAKQAAANVGCISTGNIGSIVLPSAYAEIATMDEQWGYNGDSGRRNWLITGANLEVYGGIYKVTADLLLSGIVGWDTDIYPYESSQG